MVILLLVGLLAFAQQPSAAQATAQNQPKADQQMAPSAQPTAEKPSATNPAGPQKAIQAGVNVYVYRYKQFVGSALEPSVFCDEAQLARMDNGRYFVVKLEPGKHTFRSNDKQSGLELDAKAGQEYFVRIEIAAGMMKGHGRLVLMSPEQGKYELQSKKLKPLDPDKVVDRARVSVDELQFKEAKGSIEAGK